MHGSQTGALPLHLIFLELISQPRLEWSGIFQTSTDRNCKHEGCMFLVPSEWSTSVRGPSYLTKGLVTMQTKRSGVTVRERAGRYTPEKDHEQPSESSFKHARRVGFRIVCDALLQVSAYEAVNNGRPWCLYLP